MDINRLTEKAQEALRAAQSEATRLGHQADRRRTPPARAARSAGRSGEIHSGQAAQAGDSEGVGNTNWSSSARGGDP